MPGRGGTGGEPGLRKTSLVARPFSFPTAVLDFRRPTGDSSATASGEPENSQERDMFDFRSDGSSSSLRTLAILTAFVTSLLSASSERRKDSSRSSDLRWSGKLKRDYRALCSLCVMCVLIDPDRLSCLLALLTSWPPQFFCIAPRGTYSAVCIIKKRMPSDLPDVSPVGGDTITARPITCLPACPSSFEDKIARWIACTKVVDLLTQTDSVSPSSPSSPPPNPFPILTHFPPLHAHKMPSRSSTTSLLLPLLSLSLITLPHAAQALDDGFGRTPIMGWNSYNQYACTPTESTMTSAINAMSSNGFIAAGYKYFQIDCGWQSGMRNPSNGAIAVNTTRFPNGLQGLSNLARSKGMHWTMYTDQGKLACDTQVPTKALGSLGYENQDAAFFASLGTEYVKVSIFLSSISYRPSER